MASSSRPCPLSSQLVSPPHSFLVLCHQLGLIFLVDTQTAAMLCVLTGSVGAGLLSEQMPPLRRPWMVMGVGVGVGCPLTRTRRCRRKENEQSWC